MQQAPLIEWPDPLIELVGFIASFLAVGAVMFRLRVVPSASGGPNASAEDRGLLASAAARAAAFGAVGALVSAILFAQRLPALAERRHQTVSQLLASNVQTQIQVACVAAALLGLLLAMRRVGFGWALAALGVIVNPLSAALFGQWNRLVVPIHRLAAGAWIGTLFMMVTAIAMTLRSTLPPDRRGPLVARMVNGFSPLALTSAAVLATFGVITAWQHLHTLRALWTTPYGITLIVKLLAVGAVLALGAWNWRRQKPRLGTELGAAGLRRSATGELFAAFVVLAITAILVSLPSPKPPGAPPGAGPAGQAQAQAH